MPTRPQNEGPPPTGSGPFSNYVVAYFQAAAGMGNAPRGIPRISITRRIIEILVTIEK